MSSFDMMRDNKVNIDNDFIYMIVDRVRRYASLFSNFSCNIECNTGEIKNGLA